ncbi:MAG: KipI family sensor histidine kinase inhibitor [Psychrobacter glaciei]|jgi:KipI family sensor histidine kinase inhibitor
MKIQVASENSLIVYFADSVSQQVSEDIFHVSTFLKAYVGYELIDLVPSYASILVVFNPLITDHLHIRKLIRAAYQSDKVTLSQQTKAQILPVYYSEESGPDLAQLANNAGLSIQQVIDIHQAVEYRVYAIGFAPGFAYLGEVDPRIAASRLATPRKKVPKGAVAIADRQTAVYPAESPGGWNLIGLCPIDMFNPDAKEIMPVSVGDKVTFSAISKQQFLELGGQLPNCQFEQIKPIKEEAV